MIITNAADGWVQESCARFMPAALAAVEGLRVLSARSAYEPRGVVSPGKWKALAFEKEVDGFCRGLECGQIANIVSIGDSVHEHKALLRATAGRPQCYAKSVKLAERPTVQKLVEEHELVAGAFEDVAQFDGDLDVDVGSST
mmetsp:Transcript_159096/g.506740  ORF Transcript_159096/g.506740 Transcript_159096/m.506740 type:complete len:142 (-) Transcript_159096:230-655(-)